MSAINRSGDGANCPDDRGGRAVRSARRAVPSSDWAVCRVRIPASRQCRRVPLNTPDIEWTRNRQMLLLDVHGGADLDSSFQWWGRYGNATQLPFVR